MSASPATKNVSSQGNLSSEDDRHTDDELVEKNRKKTPSSSPSKDSREYDKTSGKHNRERGRDAEDASEKRKYEKESRSSKYARRKEEEKSRRIERKERKDSPEPRRRKRSRSSGGRCSPKYERSGVHRRSSKNDIDERDNARRHRRHSGKDCSSRRDDVGHSRKHSRKHRSYDEESDKERPAWETRQVRKRAEEISKRKLLWSKPAAKDSCDQDSVADNTERAPSLAKETRPTSVSSWNSILAASATDSKRLDKFKRLMGMKADESEQVGTSNDAQVEAERERQQELYNKLDEQYTVARSITHMGRGHGLGFQ